METVIFDPVFVGENQSIHDVVGKLRCANIVREEVTVK